MFGEDEGVVAVEEEGGYLRGSRSVWGEGGGKGTGRSRKVRGKGEGRVRQRVSSLFSRTSASSSELECEQHEAIKER